MKRIKTLFRKVYFYTPLVLFLASLLSFGYTKYNPEKKIADDRYPAIVVKVVDGDTYDISFTHSVPLECEKKERIRLIGVDTPETKHPRKKEEFYGKQASQFSYEALINKNIEIRFDKNKRDKYGRLLCYVYYKNILFNEYLIEKGFAKYYPYFPFDSGKMKLFKESESRAKRNNKGIWK